MTVAAIGSCLRERIEDLRRAAEEHDRRMASDPDYAAEYTAAQAAAAETAKRQAAVVDLEYREDRWRRKSIPSRLFALLHEGLDLDREALRSVREWLASSQTFLILAGAPGVGKTVAAAWAVTQAGGLFRKARDVAWLSSFDVEARDEVIAARFLALDDLGTEPLDAAGWALSMLYSVLDARYDAAARTLVTTNLGAEAFRARYGRDGGRLFRRLREAGEWVELSTGEPKGVTP